MTGVQTCALPISYEALTGHLVQMVGFCQHDTLAVGCSPDGFVGASGLVEIKCPRAAKHVAWMRAGVVPKEHMPQLLHQAWVTGRMWVDFVSYNADLPDALRLYRITYHPSDKELADYDAAARAFLAEVDAEEQALHTMANPSQVMATVAGRQ